MKTDFLFTIFTPTYNREKTLHRVYESLITQTERGFEWLIVDDGSIDGTKALVLQWQNEANFPIRYYYQENKGKHIAFNAGVTYAKGELFLTLDSDDACTSDALACFRKHWENIPSEIKSQFSAVTCLCKNQQGKIIGDYFPNDIMDSDSLEIHYRYHIKGEKWGFHRTDILKKFPFPEIKNSNFVPEGIVWSAIARSYKTRFINEPLRIYYENDFLSNNQLTNKNSAEKYAATHALWHCGILNNDIKWFSYHPMTFLKSAVHYARFSFHNKKGIVYQYKNLLNIKAKTIWLGCSFIGWLVYLKDIKINHEEY